MAYHVILEEKVFELGELVDVLYFFNDVVLEVQGFQIYVFLKAADLVDNLVVQINFFVHLGELVKTVTFTKQLQVTLVHYQTPLSSSFQISISTRNSQPFNFTQRLVWSAKTCGFLDKLSFLRAALLHFYYYVTQFKSIKISSSNPAQGPK